MSNAYQKYIVSILKPLKTLDIFTCGALLPVTGPIDGLFCNSSKKKGEKSMIHITPYVNVVVKFHPLQRFFKIYPHPPSRVGANQGAGGIFLP